MALTARGLTRTFGRHTAVAHADVTLTPGTITGLVGPNGAGKTTLLLMLAGLLAPDSGSLRLDDQEVDSTQLRAVIGWMPDVFGTWDSLTATEILTTFGRLHGQAASAARLRAAELLDLVHLSAFADRPAHELSRGQKQRLGFARTLVNRPRVLLLDEPASGMDPRSRMELRDQLRAMADAGCAVLISSHILTELSEMVDDVVIMTAGRTRDSDRPTGHRWRVREAGQPATSARMMSFADEEAAARHLGELVAAGANVAEFCRVDTELEDAYLALDAERT
ncbi:ABC transporter ATP-binding protein [Rhodococcus triatomae]|uniref:ABC-2 type transport system ATP-binding protein n=1 Tax=Rhodococcus triatomae TaxID=300028 RepID=A0A1G8AK11_9NOCA|nr:ABC transporter ATP-binding protein [Rhodococcus triatomae]QNG17746.1 ABC transporter ATP-binding protein [Rhodococcus triatomae]QNG22587.1 ABC transporter ATP-binding protein [Rhodococcus triatomae]SDH21258.1 ABC-2 type transport system ATP-binding protein [Rhodococcus triatomae]